MSGSKRRRKGKPPKPTQTPLGPPADRPQNDTPPASASLDADRAENDPATESKHVGRLHTAVDEAAKHVVHRYTTFLLVTVYLAITIGSTTDEQLLRESPLPLALHLDSIIGLPSITTYIDFARRKCRAALKYTR